MKRASCSVRAAAVVAAAGLATAARGQNTWTGGAGTGDWHTSQNWSLGVTPQPGHEVVIPQGVPGVSASGAFVARLTAQSPLSVGTGGTTVTQNASLQDFSTTGGFVCGGAATFSGNATVQTSYTWRAAAGFTNTGTMNVTAMPLALCTLTNQGTIKVESGPLSIAGGTTSLINNGTVELRSGGNLIGSGQFVNNATWRKVGASDSEVQCNISHEGGTLAVEDGLLRLTGGGFYDGPITIELGGKVRLEGPFVALGHFFDTGGSVSRRITGGGELEIQCAGSGAVQILSVLGVELNGDNGLHMQSGGVMIAQGAQLLNRGKLRWDGGAFEGPGLLANFGTLVIPTGRSVPANDGVEIFNLNMAHIDGVLTLNDGSLFDNDTSSSTTILRGEFRAPTPASGTVRSAGELVAEPGPGNTARIHPRLVLAEGSTTSVNNGTLSLLGGGEFGPGAVRMTLSQPGTLLAFDFGTYEVLGAGIHVTAAAQSAARIRGAGTRVNVQPGAVLNLEGAGSTHLESNAQLGGAGTIINRGNFIWNSQIGLNGQAQFRNEFAVDAGSVLIPAGGARLRGTFTNTSAGDVLQQGPLDMAAGIVNNEGDWVVEPTTTTQISLSGTGGRFNNNLLAHFSAEAPPGAGRSVLIAVTLDNNQGIVQAIGGITLTVGGPLVQLQNGVLSGGTWRTAEGGRIILPGVPPITRLKNTEVVGSEQGLPWLAGIRDVEGAQLVTVGDIRFTAPLRVYKDDLEAPAVMRVGPGAEVTVPGSTTVGSPDRTTGSYLDNSRVDSFQPDPARLITPTLTVYGGLRPGGPDAPGPFNLTGQLAMQAPGVVEVELGGLEPEVEYDQMAITGAANLAGTLDVRLLPGFVPQLGQMFTVLTATGPISGTFAQVVQPAGLPGNLRLEPAYLPGAVTLTVVAGCYANCDGSTGTPLLNVNDFVCFQSQFAAGAPYADCDGNSALNVNDFVCFQGAFAAGCR